MAPVHPWVGLAWVWLVGSNTVVKFSKKLSIIIILLSLRDIRSRLSAKTAETVEHFRLGCEMGRRPTNDLRRLNVYPMFTFMRHIRVDFNVYTEQ